MSSADPRALIGANGFVKWHERPDRLDIYQTAIGWPLLATTINGFGVPASWNQRTGLSKIETLFAVLRELSNEWVGFYFTNPDECFSELMWTLPSVKPVVEMLGEFEDNPGEQGGACFLGFFYGQLENQILFVHLPGNVFRISLFGQLKVLIPEKLKG